MRSLHWFRNTWWLVPAITILMGSALQAQGSPQTTDSLSQPEIRAVWASTLNACMNSPEEIRDMVAAVRKAHLNTIIAQVRHRGITYYNSKFEPRAPAIRDRPDFDPLAVLLQEAHDTSGGKQRLDVLAWFNVFHLAPKTANAETSAVRQKYAKWLSLNPKGEVQDFVDPAIPAVQDHLIVLVEECLRGYDVDGINLDYIRYPEEEAGYHPDAIARFNRLSGHSGTPSPNDQDWNTFRRKQVTDFVRRCSVSTWRLRPDATMSVNATAFGAPSADFKNTSPYRQVFQDWAGWLLEGDLDTVTRMGYKRESVSSHALQFRDWATFTRKLQDQCPGQMITLGIGGYFNSTEGTVAQYEVAKKLRLGTSIFSYNVPTAEARNTSQTGAASPFWEVLGTKVYPAAVPPPRATWRKETAVIAGYMKDSAGKPLDSVLVELKGDGRTTMSDGLGFFMFSKVAPGDYQVACPQAAAKTRPVKALAGKVTMVE
jgi:uncharacterized lipoprotein YddW (UPF0748 family)